MRYLVLGSSGQIGTALVKYLRHTGNHVEEFDLVNSKNEDLRIFKNPLLERKISNADFVIFLAFDVGGSRYLKTYQHTLEFLSNNSKLMENTFDYLSILKKPFIFASSQMSNMSYSPYGILKALGEFYTRALNGLIVKFWNVYGVEHNFEKSHVITDFILSAREKRRIDMLTDGKEQRQFLYADDCSECLYILSEKYNEIPRDQQLHITSFKWYSILEVAKYVVAIFPETKITPAVEVDDLQKNKRNEPNNFILNYWKPKTTLQSGIKKVAEQLTDNNN